MKALVLTGGFGTRLREVINDRPKVMAPIGDKPFLSYLLKNLKNNGIFEVVLSLGYLGDYIRDYFKDGTELGLHISYSEESTPLGTGGAVRAADKYFREPYFVMNGDTYSEINYSKLLDFHLRSKASATLVVTSREDVRESGYVKFDRFGKIMKFVEKQKDSGVFKKNWVNSGVYVLNPRIIRNVKKVRFSLERDFFPKLILKGKVFGFKNERDFIDIGTRENYFIAKQFLARKSFVQVETKVPARISFGGGGTDMPLFFQSRGGAVCGATINMFAHVKLTPLSDSEVKINLLDFGREQAFMLEKKLKYDKSDFDIFKAVINLFCPKQGFAAKVWGDFRAGSGLGTSSAVTLAFVCAVSKFCNKELASGDAARIAIQIEREELKIPGGWQDQYLCALGGFNYIEFSGKGNVHVKQLNPSEKMIKNLEENLLMFFIKGERSQQVLQRAIAEKIDERTENLEKMKAVARKISYSIAKGDFESFAKLLDRSWFLKRNSSEKISNNFIDRIYETAKSNGSLGGKLLGAGGGGYLLLYCPQKAHHRLINALAEFKLSAEKIDFNFSGAEMKTYED